MVISLMLGVPCISLSVMSFSGLSLSLSRSLSPFYFSLFSFIPVSLSYVRQKWREGKREVGRERESKTD